MIETAREGWSDLHPFDQLKEIERRSLGAEALDSRGDASVAVFTGLAFRLGSARLVAPMNEVDEVLRVPRCTRVPGAQSWVRGVANLRGTIVSVIDLGSFLGEPSVKEGPNARIIVVNNGGAPSGLLVNELVGMRHFYEDQAESQPPESGEQTDRYLTGAYRIEGTVWSVMSIPTLLADPRFAGASG